MGRVARTLLVLPDAVMSARERAWSAAGLDPFYSVPSPLPPGAPGDVIREEPTQVYFDRLKRTKPRARVWRIMYRSTSATDEPIAVTGTLFVPSAPHRSGPRPLVSFACGGHAAMGAWNAPSISMARGTPREQPIMATFLARGWAVVVTDYQRWGGAGVHTFVVSKVAGQAVLDAARAAARVPGAGLSASGPVACVGYSEGGNASAAAAERHPIYAPELNLVAGVAGGVPADLLAMARNVEGKALFVGVVFSVAGLTAAFPELPLDGLTDRGRTEVSLAAQMPIERGVARYGYRQARDFSHGTLDEFFVDQPQWRVRVEEQHIGRLAPTTPVFLFHGQLDPWVPYEVGTTLRDDWTARGAQVHFRSYPRSEHFTALGRALPSVHSFLGAHFNGRASLGAAA